MRQVYNKISFKTGAHIAGFCKIHLAPREWLVSEMQIDFATGKIIADPVFIAGKDFIELDILPNTYKFDEKPKNGKPGTFYDITLSGTSNDLSADLLQSLNSYRYHEFVVKFKDMQHRLRIAGNKDAGMTFQFSNSQSNTQVIDIDLVFQHEYPAPFFQLPTPRLETSGLVAEASGSIAIILTWNTVSGATNYIVERSTSSDFSTALTTIYTGAGTNFLDDPLTPDTTYYYRIHSTGVGYLDSLFGIANATTEAAVFSPADIANIFGVWDGDAGIDNPVSTGQWDDQSGQGNHFKQPTLNRQVRQLANILNGHSVVALKAPVNVQGRMKTDNNFPFTTGATIFMVASQAVTAEQFDGSGTFLEFSQSSLIHRAANATAIYVDLNSDSVAATAITDGTFYTFRIDTDGVDLNLAINGTVVASGTTTQPVVQQPIYIFQNHFNANTGNKQFAMIIAYNRILTGPEITQVEAYLQSRFAHY